MVRRLLSGLGLASVLGLAACSRQPACVMPDDPPRILDLTRASDRRHLAADFETATRLAEAYGQWAAQHPPSDARFVTAEGLERDGRAYCQALLAERISAMHGVAMPRVERALADQARFSQR